MKKGLPSGHVPMCRVRRALIAQLDAAVAQLLRGTPSDRNVHSVREKLKRARAALRLLRTCIGTATYRRFNTLIRDAARPLTKVRDSQVLLHTLRALQIDADSNGSGAPKHGPVNSFARLLDRELRRQRMLQRQGLEKSELHAAAAALRSVKRGIEGVSETRLARGTVGDALERAYRAARRAYGRTLLLATDARLHESRKQTKYLFHQLDIVAPAGSSIFAKRRKRARRLARCLGDDHDLAVLRAALSDFAKGANAPGRNAEAADLLRRLMRRRTVLQHEARALGRRQYARGPARMRRTFEEKLGALRTHDPA